MDRATYPEVVAASTSDLKSTILDLRFAYCFGRAALLTPPYLVLHREEFAWPHMSPCAPVRSYIKPVWAAPFHPSPRVRDLSSDREFRDRNLKIKTRSAG